MGGGIATSPLPPVTAEAIDQLTRAFYRMLEEQKELREVHEETNRLLRKHIEPPSKWVSQDEAAVMLGQTIKPSGSHLTHLKRYRKNDWLSTYASRNPYRYLRKEVEALAFDFERKFGDPLQKYPLPG